MKSQRPLICGVFYFMEKEIWKDVVGYEGCYQVSNLGNVKSLKRIVKFGNSVRVIPEKILKQLKNKRGYLEVKLSIKSKTSTKPVHKLIGLAFIPHEKGMCVNHIDQDKTNNKLINLEIVNHIENDCYSIDKSKTTSKYIGVRFKNNGWETQIRFQKKRYYLGRYKTEDEARKAYLNFIKENNIVNKYL